MQQLRNERGYSLLLTLMLVLLFSIMGAALIAMTFNGLARNETRESTVQSIDLATKGEQYLIADINNKTNVFVKNSNILTNTDFNREYNKILSEYFCNKNTANLLQINKNLNLNNTTGTASICIEKVEPYENSLTKMKVTFKSIGSAENKDTTVTSTYLMGAQEVKESLKYSVSTFLNDKKGGNLILHGGSDITGDISVENNLFTSNYSYGLSQWAKSVLPRAINSNLYLKNDLKTFDAINYNNNEKSITKRYTECWWFICDTKTKSLNYETHINSDFSSDFYKTNTLLTNNFHYENLPILRSGMQNSVFYDVTTAFENSITFSNTNTSSAKWKNESNRDTSYQRVSLNGTNIVVPSISSPSVKGIKYNNDVYINGNNTKVELKVPIYIKGDLIIGDIHNFSNSSATYDDITLNGSTIFVEGKVRIRGVNLIANANLYVRGDDKNSYAEFYDNQKSLDSNLITSLRNLTLKGYGNNGSLIIFSEGDLQVANISYNEPTASSIEGYFYTEKSMELYGFASNLHIKGGISANNIILNAMRGDSPPACPNLKHDYQIISGECFENEINQNNSTSTSTSKPRLAIEYNKSILDTYSKNQEGIYSKITENDIIDKVKLLDRKQPQ